MAIDFPSTGLTVGQIFTSGGASWKWDGTKWVSNAASDGYLPLAGGTISGTAPGYLYVDRQPATTPLPATGVAGIWLAGNDGEQPLIGVDSFGANAPLALLRHANGTGAARTATAQNDVIGSLQYRGYGATDFSGAGAIRLTAVAIQAWTDAVQGAKLTILTTPNGSPASSGTQVAEFSQGMTLGTPSVTAGADNGRGTLIANANAAAPINPGLTNQTVLAIGADGGANNIINVATGSANYYGLRGNTAIGTPATLTATNVMLRVNGGGWDGTAWVTAGPGQLAFTANETWSASAHGTIAQISTTPNGSITPAVNLTLDGSGNLTIVGGTATKAGGGSWVAPSDPALKSDVTPYTDGLNVLLQLQPVRYAYNGRAGTPDDGRQYVGLDAEAAAAAMPSLIGEMTYQPTAPNEEGEPVPEGMPETYRTVDPSELIFTLINSVRELSARLTAMEAKLA